MICNTGHRKSNDYSNKKNLVLSALIAISLRVLGAVASILLSISAARLLSISDAGTFLLTITIVTILWTLCSLGMPVAVLRFIGIYESKNNWTAIINIFNSAFSRVLLASLPVAFLFSVLHIFPIAFLFFDGLEDIFIAETSFIFLAIPFIALSNLIGYAFQGLYKAATSILLQTISIPITTCSLVWLNYIYSGDVALFDFVLAYFIASVLNFSIGFLLWIKKTVVFKFDLHAKSKELFISAKPLYITTSMGLLVQWTGVITVGVFLSVEDVALFSVAQRVSLLTSFVLVAVNFVVAPRLASAFAKRDNAQLKSIAILSNRLMILCSIPLLLLMMFYPEYILSFFGPEYIGASQILRILAIGQFVNVATGSVGYLLNMTGHEKDMMNVVFLSGPLVLILSGILIPLYGLTGAAIATSIALASQNLLAVYKVKQRLGFNTLNIF